MVADANVGGTKSDVYLKKTMNVMVEVYPDGLSRHSIALKYYFPPPRDEIDRALNAIDAGAYHDYVRFYLPETATIASIHQVVDGKEIPSGIDSITFSHNRQVVATFFRLTRQHEIEVRLAYIVPVAADGKYNLFVQKQPGILDKPTSIEVSYPGGIARRTYDLSQDVSFSVRW
jgi:hypothetical protein